MSLTQLTEYLLWKSLKNKITPRSQSPCIKQEFSQNKQEIFDNDMICRVCTNPADIPITEKFNDILIITAIRTVANISLNEADYYPKFVCKICLDELQIAFQFKKKCEASDMTFRKAISSETTIVTQTQPMVMHDFPLILHQMKQNRLSHQNTPVKHDDTMDNDFDYDEMVNLPPDIKEDTEITLPSIDKKKSKTVKTKRILSVPYGTQNQINEILKITDVNENIGSSSDANIHIGKYKPKKLSAKSLKEHKCKRCNLKFDSQDELQKHRKQNSCVYHPCPLCGKLVLNLTNHEKIVHLRPNKYTCHQCGKVYYSSGALANHMHIHRETKEYFCDHCPYSAKRKSYLVCHMRVHTGEHRYLCSECPLKFSNTSNLRKHQLIHYSKKFECSKCKRLFRQEKHLKDHFDAAHLNIRYRCSLCSKDLCTRKKLLNHELRVHKREKHKLFEEVQKVVVWNDND